MAFLTSRSASKHVPFALGVHPTARDAGEGGGSDLVSQATPFAVSYETSSHPCSLATQGYYRQASQEIAAKVLFLLFGGSGVIARLTSGKRATCSDSEICDLHSVQILSMIEAKATC